MTLTIRFVPRPAHDQTPTQRAEALSANAMVRVSRVNDTYEVDSSEHAELAKYALSMSAAERQTVDVKGTLTNYEAEQFGAVVAAAPVRGWTSVYLPARADVMGLFQRLSERDSAPKKEAAEPREPSVLPPELIEAGQIMRDAAEKAFDKVSPLLFREGRKLARQFGSRR